jgi:hypothetical protein
MEGYDWILDLFTPHRITSNYSAIADLQTLQVTAANTKSSAASNVFNSRFLITDVNSRYSSASRALVLPVRRIFRKWTLINSSQLNVKVKVKIKLRLKVSQSVSQSVSQWGSCPDIYYCLTVTVLLLWDALSDERTGPPKRPGVLLI